MKKLSDSEKVALAGHFGKAAEFHEEKAAAHKAAGASHRTMAAAHKSAHGAHTDKAEKVFHKAGFEHHNAKAVYHEGLAKAHSAMADTCKAVVYDMGSDGTKVEAPTVTKAAHVGDAVDGFWKTYFPSTEAPISYAKTLGG